MKMSKLEHAAKNQIMDILNKQGYPTYSKLLQKLDVKLLDKGSEAVAYLDTRTATIYLNAGLSIEQVSTITRHEILHEYLTHMKRAEKFKLSDPKYKNIPHDLVNIAADYEISNRGYTDKDKQIARSIVLNDKVLQGLVTEDQHPDWVSLSFEEMLAKLSEDSNALKNALKNIMKDMDENPPPTQQQADQMSQQADGLSDDAKRQANQSRGNHASQMSQKQAELGDESKDKAEEKGGESAENKADQLSDEADNLSGKADQLSDKIAKNNKSKESNSGPFDTTQQQKVDQETAKKAEELRKALNELQDRIMGETEEQITKEIAAKKAKDVQKYKESPMSRFTDSLNNFIKNELAIGRGKTWTRMSKKYVGSGLIKAGTSRLAQGHIPLINVYFDRSGSWDDPNKTKKGEQAIATLNKYVNRGELKINLYYFSNNVHSNEQEALNEGGTYGQPILEHIEATKPDNVIILTDDDISDCRSNVTVPGGVWMLFYGNRSYNLIDHLHGRKLTKYFDIEY